MTSGHSQLVTHSAPNRLTTAIWSPLRVSPSAKWRTASARATAPTVAAPTITDLARHGRRMSAPRGPRQFQAEPFHADPFQALPFQAEPFQPEPFHALPFQLDPFQLEPFQELPFQLDPFQLDPLHGVAPQAKPFQELPFQLDPFQELPFQLDPFQLDPFHDEPLKQPGPPLDVPLPPLAGHE